MTPDNRCIMILNSLNWLVVLLLCHCAFGFKIYFPFIKIDDVDVDSVTQKTDVKSVIVSSTNESPTIARPTIPTNVATKPIIGLKHEFDNEFPLEVSTPSSDCVNISTSQEIDESANCNTQKATTTGCICKPVTSATPTIPLPSTQPPVTTTTIMTSTTRGTTTGTIAEPTTPSSGLEIDETKKNKLNSPLDKKIVAQLPVLSLPKRKEITVTKTLIKVFTKFRKVLPSCLKLEKASTACAGGLKVINPTRLVDRLSTNDNSYEVVESLQESLYKDTSVESASISQQLNKTPLQFRAQFNAMDPTASEYDYDFEVLSEEDVKSGKLPTPQLENEASRRTAGALSSNVIDSYWQLVPKISFVTEYIPSTTIQVTTDKAVTATIIASKCIPQNINLPLCSE